MNRRGFVTALAIAVVAVLAILGASFLNQSLNEGQLGRRTASRQAAFYLAEAGLDQASINLRTLDTADDVLSQGLETGTFTINAPTDLGGSRWLVTTQGVSNGAQRRLEAVFELTPQSVFQYAMFGAQSVNVSGHAQTDSYDSRLGPYEDTPGPGYNKGQDGDVGTNGTTVGGITVSGSIFIEGQLVVGPGVDPPESIITGYDPAFVTGNPKVVAEDNPFPMPTVEPPLGLTCSDETVSGNTTMELSPTGGPLGNGTYCFRDLTLSGGSTFTTSGPVVVYLTGQLTASGNAEIGVESAPQHMLFLMTPQSGVTLQEGTLTGSTEFYGAIYGPEATLEITGNAEVFGSIIAKTVHVTGNATIHYDEGLTDLVTVANTYQRTVVSWRELD